MINGNDPQLVLDLVNLRGAELRAEAERYRLARRACGRTARQRRERPAAQ
jgi:hypothetical protein